MELGEQRGWVWRGWRSRYTYIDGPGIDGPDINGPDIDGPEMITGEPQAVSGEAVGGEREVGAKGEKVPLLLVHGFGASIEHWRHNLQPLAQGRRVYALDLLGFGASEKAVAPYSTGGLWAEQVYDFWQTLIQRPVVLVGHSLGSLVCLAVAVRYPQMVRGLVLVTLPDGSVLQKPRSLVLQTAIACLQKGLQPLLTLGQSFFTFPVIFWSFFQVIRQPWLIRRGLKSAYVNDSQVSEDLVMAFTQPTEEEGAVWALKEMVLTSPGTNLEFKAPKVLPHLSIPILLFWGKQDLLVPSSLAKYFPTFNERLELIVLEKAGHCLHDECADEMNARVLSWLAQEVDMALEMK